jgi:hypothetical protein
MADARTCNAQATRASLALGPWNGYGSKLWEKYSTLL